VKRMKRTVRLCLLASLLGLAFCTGVLAQVANQPIVALEVSGNQHVPTENILAVSGLKIGDLATDEALRTAAQNIANMGFFVPHSVVPGLIPMQGGVKVIFNVVEYPVVSAIKFVGNEHVPADELIAQMETKIGKVFNEASIRQDQRTIQSFYQSKGYVVLILKTDVDPDTGVLTIRLKEVTVHQVKVEGNRKTATKVILRELKTKPGRVLNINTMKDDLRTLKNLDLFEEVSSRLDPVVDKDGKTILGEVDFVVVVKEKRTGNLGLGMGYSPRDGMVGFISVSEQNFRGKGQQARLYLEQGGRQSYDLFFREPWLDKRHTSLAVGLYDKISDRDLYFTGTTGSERESYTEKRRGFSLNLGRPAGKNKTLSLGFKREHVERSSDVLEDYYLFEPLGDTATVSLAFLEDSRDYFAWPTRGRRLRFEVEKGLPGLGGDFSYTKFSTEYARYFCLKRREGESQSTVLALRLMAGTSSGDVPVFESFIVGGADSLRGYKEERFWGEKMLLATLEYRFPLAKQLQGVGFIDMGDAWQGKWAEPYVVPDDSFDLHIGYGIGIRVNTPIGPVRIDYGIGEDGARTHFSIGHAF